MAEKLQIAVNMELNWPYKRHYEPFAGIQEYAKENGDWELCITNFPDFEIAQGAKIDGIIGRITPECLQAARRANIPMVNMWIESPVADQIPRVQVDYHAAGRMAAEHLIIRGFRRIAHFGYKTFVASKDHRRGAKEVTDEHDVAFRSYSPRPNFLENLNFWKTFVSDLIQMTETWNPPIGIVAASDEMAHTITTQLLRAGWLCPDDFAVVGTHNETLVCNAVTPNLSSVDLAHRRSGYEAARLLNRIMLGSAQTTEIIKVPPKELIARVSSDAYAVEDPVIKNALRFMAQNIHQKISVPDIAAAVGVGRQTIERRFRKQLDRTVNDELIRLRISKMKRLLINTDHTISEISEIVGFGTTVNMNIMFKRHTGTTPQTYRNNHPS